MTTKPFAKTRILPIAAIASLVAMLAPASPAAAHHHGGHHHHLGDDSAGTGTIASFDPSTGKLVVDLAEGETASGLVTDFTRIDCGCDHGGWDGRRQFHDFGDDHGWSHDGGADCDSSDLVVGAVVKDAVLILKDGHAYFLSIELEG